MPETPEQYTERILGHVQGKDPLRVQREAPKKLAVLLWRAKPEAANAKTRAGQMVHSGNPGPFGGHGDRSRVAAASTFWATMVLPSRPTIRTSGRRLLTMSIATRTNLWSFSRCCARAQPAAAQRAAEEIMGELRFTSGTGQGIGGADRAALCRT